MRVEPAAVGRVDLPGAVAPRRWRAWPLHLMMRDEPVGGVMRLAAPGPEMRAERGDRA